MKIFGFVLTLKRGIIWCLFVASTTLIVIIEVIAPIDTLIVVTSVCVITPVVATVIATIVCVFNLRCLHGLEDFQHVLLYRVDCCVCYWLDDQIGLVIRLLRYWDQHLYHCEHLRLLICDVSS